MWLGGALEHVRGREYIPGAVAGEAEDAAARAFAAGAPSPLEYIGAGMTAFVFCAGDVAYKVARHPEHPVAERFMTDEAEWLATAGGVPWVRDHVAEFDRLDHEHLVIVRECVSGKTGTWGQSSKLRDIHGEIERLMIPYGWTAPEFKEDSYVVARGRGPVLVDASMPLRVGKRLVMYVQDILAGRRPAGDDRPSDLAFYVRREMQQGTIPPGVGGRVLERLREAGAE